jgi:hypothetical protein
VRAWERLESTARPTAKPSDPSALLGHFDRSFRLNARYWQAIGRRRARSYQFRFAGAEVEDWIVRIDARGGRVEPGTEPAFDAAWISDAEAALAVIRGEVRGDLGDRVRFEGDLELLEELFVGAGGRR